MPEQTSAFTSSPRTQRLALVAVVGGAVATAFNPVFVRLTELEPVASAFHRMLWALPLMLLWAAWERPPPRAAETTPRDRWLLALCGVFFAADLAALHWSIELTVAAHSILFLNAQPIYVAIGAWFLFGSRISYAFLSGMSVALLGAVLLTVQSLALGGGHLLGDALGVTAGLCYAGFILTASRLRARYSSARVNAWTCALGAPLLMIATLGVGENPRPPSVDDWLLMIGLGVVSQAIGQGLIVWGLAHLAPAFSAVALLVAPVAAALFAWWLLGESLSALQGLGMAVVLTGVALCTRFNPSATFGPSRNRADQ